MPKTRILVVANSASLAQPYVTSLTNDLTEIFCLKSAAEACRWMQQQRIDVLILDYPMQDMDGFGILAWIKGNAIDCEVIVATTEGSVKLAVETIRSGAFDFIVKPFSPDRLRTTVLSALEQSRAARLSRAEAAAESAKPAPRIITSGAAESLGIMGESPIMQSVFRLIRSVAPTDATVFIKGESGTGKELCAEALHKHSKRSRGPFVVINCAAIPKDLLESEIFGHAKGAFTGAACDRKGAAMQADGGTLFLDEIGEMDIGLQAKMLRFLQDRKVRRLGEDTERAADVRIVCATNRDPQTEIAEGRMREDLFYRLYVVPIELPPLRERGSDIMLIARYFLRKFAKEDKKNLRDFTEETASRLLDYSWPGNIRQLQNVMRLIVVLNDGELVSSDMLPREMMDEPADARLEAAASQRPSPLGGAAPLRPDLHGPEDTLLLLEEMIQRTIAHAISAFGGSIPKAAVALKVSPSTLYRRLQSLAAPIADA